jgi:hypothetical protein
VVLAKVDIILYHAANEGVTTGAGKLMIDHLRWRQLRIGIVMKIRLSLLFSSTKYSKLSEKQLVYSTL